MGSDDSERSATGDADVEPGQSVKPSSKSASGAGRGENLPAIDFSTFILSLSTTALYQMGLVPEPGSGRKIEPNLVIAQQTIDTLEILRVKTRGNLEDEEEKLFESLLYELRVRFVEVSQ